MKKMHRDQRYEWLLAYIKKHGGVDVLNSDFVDSYVAATGMKVETMVWGANRCRALGRDLAHMEIMSALKRFRIGLGGNWQPGFPKWVWSYNVGHAAYLYEPRTSSADQ